jgi:succinate---hydroxymethylglutarate CoA-transferase
VIKIEHPTGDDTRTWGPPFKEGESAYFICCNRNKLSVVLDMKIPESRRIMDRLILRSDVLVQNFVTGKEEMLGLGYERVAKINPRIIYCAISGFGSSGMYATKPGYDSIISAMYGMQHITGEEGGGPMKPGVAVTDVLTGLLAVSGINAALYERSLSGLGQRVDTSLMEAQLSSLVNIASNYLISGKDNSKRWGTAHPSIAPYQTFLCDGGGGLSIAGANDAQFVSLCRTLQTSGAMTREEEDIIFDRNELSNQVALLSPRPIYQTNADRVQHKASLCAALEAVFMRRTSDFWAKLFEGKGFPFGPVRSIEQALTCPQSVARDMVQTIAHPTCGPIKVVGPPIKFSRTACTIRLPPPLLGEHTIEVLRSLLHFSDEEIESFARTGAITDVAALQQNKQASD